MTLEDQPARSATLRHAESDDDLRACWPVMQQLRPHIPSADDFIARVSRMRGQSYRLLAAWRGDTVLAMAGYRLQENLVYGRFLYLDDLVTHESARGEKWGARLIEAMVRTASEAGCVKLVLDTGLSNARAQRFYFREGLLSSAMRFNRPISATTAQETA
ncbi:GNAT family N-acetyltransferase [Rhodoferax koreense]|uniref:GNAT family N-acetyltransferase n=1 Tax=Rhodoferax koreensis TaxID=1842727 RepID=A0A1P8JSN7_9BURK|nr:GNAT family N-acetyltransferase [Rhodoferax koreense]APW36767.1 GNAT family N-acetyltransferase [Rhodoferax koreense]